MATHAYAVWRPPGGSSTSSVAAESKPVQADTARGQRSRGRYAMRRSDAVWVFVAERGTALKLVRVCVGRGWVHVRPSCGAITLMATIAHAAGDAGRTRIDAVACTSCHHLQALL